MSINVDFTCVLAFCSFQKVMDLGLKTMDLGLKTMDLGYGTMDLGYGTMDFHRTIPIRNY